MKEGEMFQHFFTHPEKWKNAGYGVLMVNGALGAMLIWFHILAGGYLILLSFCLGGLLWDWAGLSRFDLPEKGDAPHQDTNETAKQNGQEYCVTITRISERAFLLRIQKNARKTMEEAENS